MLAPVELLRDEAVVPAQEGIRGGERGDLFQAFATERVGERGKAAAFGVGQAQPAATELGFEDAVFLKEIGDDLLLVTLEPAGDHGDQDVEDHSRSSGWRHDDIVSVQYTPNLSNFNGVETAEIFGSATQVMLTREFYATVGPK